MRLSAGIVVALFGLALRASGDEPTPKVADRESRLHASRTEFETEFLKGFVKYAKAADSVKAKLYDSLFNRTLPPYIRRAQELIDEQPGDEVAFAALVWVLQQQAAWNLLERDQHSRLLSLIEKHHLGRADLDRVICFLPWLELDVDEKISGDRKTRFMKRVLDESKHESVRGLACFTLAEWSFHDHERAAADLKSDPKAVAVLWAEAEQLLVRTEREFADVQYDPRGGRRELDAFLRKVREATTGRPSPEGKRPKLATLGETAAGYLVELRQLTIGKRPPWLIGEDLSGVKLGLSGEKGKVVVVTFWASWCAPCMARVPAEIELVTRLKDKPFAFIGVNGDEDKDAATKAERKSGMNWRSIWAGRTDDQILKAWHVRHWPTVYVIDHTGVIRGKDLHGKELDRLVDALVSDAEKAAQKK